MRAADIASTNYVHEAAYAIAAAVIDDKKGQPGGVASLDETGKVPVEQIPIMPASASTIPTTAPATPPPTGQVYIWFE